MDKQTDGRMDRWTDGQIDRFLRSHALAFAALGGLTSTLLYGNPQKGRAPTPGRRDPFQPAVLAPAQHGRFMRRPVDLACGMDGRVQGARAPVLCSNATGIEAGASTISGPTSGAPVSAIGQRKAQGLPGYLSRH